MQQLRALLVQASLKWQRPADNRAHLDELLAGQSGTGGQARMLHQSTTATAQEHALTDFHSVGVLDIVSTMPARSSVAKASHNAPLNRLATSTGATCGLVVLPETFTTGFLGDEGEAETMNGPTVAWMQAWAERLGAVVTGSVVIEDGGRYNRLLWVEPGGQVQHYDKRHLFAHGGEDRRYSAGTERRVFDYRGWRSCPQVCYDIRFPVWCRSRGDYDLLLVVANWPSARAGAWRSLLQARAIENQCYVVAVNRVGEDGHGKRYPGGSVVFDPMGETLLELGDSEGLATRALDLGRVAAVREQLPFQRDADNFELKV